MNEIPVIKMTVKRRFIKRYKEGVTPWAHKNPDFNLVDMVKEWPVEPCKTLEIGCGTGTDAIWLARQGFEVIASDISGIAIQEARKSAEEEDVECNFLVIDFLHEKIPGAPFDFAFDRGVFHSFKHSASRKKFAKKVAQNLAKDGLWLSLVGSKDRPEEETGPPRRSAANSINAVEPFFEVLSLHVSKFGSDSPIPSSCWVCLMKKRP